MTLRFLWLLFFVWILFHSRGRDGHSYQRAGATFPYPLYSKWFAIYNRDNPNIRFNYQAIGSGGGIRQLLKQTVDFGASDAPMKAKDIQKSSWKIRHIPTVLGAVAISYNLPSLKQPLKLDGPALANIFLGQIKKWKHPSIAALNPELTLPDRPILVVRRADGSGTTAIFSDYLANVSPPWKQDVGQGKTLRWPVGIGAKGNDGVAAQIKNNQGAIGYVELAYSIKIGLPTVALKNRAGSFVAPTISSISASARGVDRYQKWTLYRQCGRRRRLPHQCLHLYSSPGRAPQTRYPQKFSPLGPDRRTRTRLPPSLRSPPQTVGPKSAQ